MPLYFTIKRKLNPLWAISFDNEKFPKNSKNSDRLIKIFPSTSINNRFPFSIPRHNRRTTSSDQLLQNVKKRKISPLKNSIIVENHPAHFQQHSKPWFGRRATRADRWSNRKFRKFQRIVDERASFAAISRECRACDHLPDTYPSSLFRNASMSQWKPVLVTMFRAFNATVARGRKRGSLRGKGLSLSLALSSSERGDGNR